MIMSTEDEDDDNRYIKILYGSSYCAGLVKEAVEGIKNRGEADFQGGRRGTYEFMDREGNCVAIVKPTDEDSGAPNNPGWMGSFAEMGQPGICPYIMVGECAYREVAAYLLDHDHFAKVPMTALVEISHWIFNINDGLQRRRHHYKEVVTKKASLRQYIECHFDVLSCRPPADYLEACVHRIGILDIRICNVTRNERNILARKLGNKTWCGKVELIPIGYGLCLPEALDVTWFDVSWRSWPQASTPFSEEEREYIRKLDPLADADMLRKELPMIPEASIRILVVCTIFLKEAAHFGFCLSEIGYMMDRDFVRFGEPFSQLELVCLDVKTSLLPPQTHSTTTRAVGFADMDEDAWSLFLKSFPPALLPAFHNHLAIIIHKS